MSLIDLTYYLLRAGDARALARDAGSAAIRDILLEVVRDYDHLAAEARRAIGAGDKP